MIRLLQGDCLELMKDIPVVSESGEGFIFPRDTVETIEVRRSLL